MGLSVLDAGVLIAVLDASDRHHAAARGAIAAAQHAGEDLVVPASAYAEVLVGPLRKSAERAAIVDAFLDTLPASIEAATRSIAREAAALRARHGGRLRLPDALVVATATILRADRVMTTDAGWPDVGLTVDVLPAPPVSDEGA